MNTKNSKPSIKCAFLNVNSIESTERQNKVFNLLNCMELDILCLAETKILESPSHLSNCSPKGYTYFHVSRRGATRSGAGGVGIILRSSFHVSKKIHLKFEAKHFEFLAIEIITKMRAKPIHLVTVYRPPQGKLNDFFQEFEKFCDLYENDSKLIVVGDFNIPMNNEGDPKTLKFLEVLNEHSLHNHVEVATFKRSGNILDLVIDNYVDSNILNVTVSPEMSFSDHCLISFDINTVHEKVVKHDRDIVFRSYNDINKKKFYDYLMNSFAEFDDYNPSSVSLTEKFYAIIRRGLALYFPELHKTIRVSEQNPWYDSECKKAKRAVRKAERKYQADKTNETNKTLFQNALKHSVITIADAKTKYYENIFSLAVANPKKSYAIISELLGEKIEKVLPTLAATDPQRFADDYCFFLHSKISRIRRDLETGGTSMRVQSARVLPYEPITSFSEITPDEFDEILSRCRRTFCTLDLLQFKNLELDGFKPYLLKIINNIFKTGIFPKEEKCAIIYPYIKDLKGDIEDFNNYRPVSNISFIGKIYEQCIYYRLAEYINRNELLPIYQSAYRKNHSTESALTKVYNDIIVAKDEGLCTMMVYLDLSAAFDTIDHSLLKSELFHLGIRGRALDLVSSYLEGRTVQVQVKDKLSSPRPLLFGVPQGSVLGPVLFSLYVRSIHNVFKDLDINYHSYADDTVFYLKFKPSQIDLVKERLGHIFVTIEDWMSSRRLKININKTKLMIVSPRGCKSQVLRDFDEFEYAGNKLKPSNEVKTLGIIFDSELNFDSQINSLVRKCNFSIFKLKNVRKHVPRNMFTCVVQSEIMSRLDYCNVLYFNLPQAKLRRMQVIMNRAVRLIFNLPRRAHITNYLRDILHWLPIGPRIDFKLLLISFKTLKENEPKYLTPFFVKGDERTRTPFLQPRIPGGHKFAMSAFCYAAPALMNKLPKAIRDSKSVEVFKNNLKTYLFRKGYDHRFESILKYNPNL